MGRRSLLVSVLVVLLATAALALIAPAYLYWLLTRVSGVPPLEEHMRRTRPKAFADYARRTSVFFLRPPRA